LWFGVKTVARQSIRDWKGECGYYIYGPVAEEYLQQFFSKNTDYRFSSEPKKLLNSRLSKKKV
jgi:hypothetical protein